MRDVSEEWGVGDRGVGSALGSSVLLLEENPKGLSGQELCEAENKYWDCSGGQEDKLNFRMLERRAGGRRWSRSVRRMGAKRILLQNAVGPMSKRKCKNDCSKSPLCSGHCARTLNTFFLVIPVTLILLLTTWSTQMHTPGSKRHEKKTFCNVGWSQSRKHKLWAFSCVNPQTGNRSLHVRGCQPRRSNSGERQVLISGDGDLVIGKGHTENPRM